MKQAININVSSTVAVYQTWDMGRDLGDDVRCAARNNDTDELRKLLRKVPSAAYCGSFDLDSDMTLEQIYVMLQNDSHREGWVKALGAQDGWLESAGGAASLSMGDMLVINDRRYVVGLVGFIEVN